jgi:hypothetical protein
VKDVLTFYNHRGIRITDQWLAIDGRRYLVRDMTDVRTTRGPINRLAVNALGAGVSLLAVAILLGPVLPLAMAVLLGAFGLVAAGTGFVATRTSPRQQALWADIKGVEVMLFATTDTIEMGKVVRALQRARERDARFLVS